MKTFIVVLLLSFRGLLGLLHAQDTLRVPQMYGTIQGALSAASANDIVLVSPGTYYENILWPNNVYGIQLKSLKGPDSTIIDGNNSGCVIKKYNLFPDRLALIEGFTIQHGKAQEGGGIFIEGEGVRLRNLRVTHNQATGFTATGGGISLRSYAGSIEYCDIHYNEAKASGPGYGGGIYLSLRGPVSMSHISVLYNINEGTNSSNGGGMYIYNQATHELVIRKSQINRNTTKSSAHSYGAGMYVESGVIAFDSCFVSYNSTGNATNAIGGGIFTRTSQFIMRNSEVLTNGAKIASAIAFDAATPTTNTFENCAISFHEITSDPRNCAIEASKAATNMVFKNCAIDRNLCTSILVDNAGPVKSNLHFIHCTVARSCTALKGRNLRVVVDNSIFWNGKEFDVTGMNEITVRSSLIKGGYPGTGNIDADPLFLDPLDLTLTETSPCLAAGNPELTIMTDYFGMPRPMPQNTLPDLGAYELNQATRFVHLRFYYDADENGKRDPDERHIQYGAAIFQQGHSYSNFRKEGFLLAVEPGPLTLEYDERLFPGWKVTSSPLYTTQVDSAQFHEIVEFGMAPKQGYTEARPYISSAPVRCGEAADFHIKLLNEYAVLPPSILWLQLDPGIPSYAFQPAPDTLIAGNKLGWSIDILHPGESYTVTGHIMAPVIQDTSQLGDIYRFIAWADTDEEKMFTYETPLRCSFDPNDKLVNPHRSDSLALIRDALFYTIRFQNTGNDYARNISIVDTLSNALDIHSFRVVQTSHPDCIKVLLDADHIVTFSFENIFLPDSLTDFEGSNGFVSFSIHADKHIEPYTEISNTAAIFFDFNPPVITNTTSSIMVEEYITAIHWDPLGIKALFPNPTDGWLYIQPRADEIGLFDRQGHLCGSFTNTDRIDIAFLSHGVYFLRCRTDDKVTVHKVVLIK